MHVSAADVQRVAATLIAARERLRHRPFTEIVAALAEVVAGWLAPDSARRQRAETELPAATGFSPAMIRHGLPLMLAPLHGDAVGRLLDSELGRRARVNEISGPPLILHVLSGNIPALAAIPMALSLAIRSAVMVKASHGDQLFPALFVESLREIDEALGACADALYWTGGRLDVETAAFGAADLVVASGNDQTIADIGRRVRGRFIGHGHRLSFAAVARETLVEPTAIAARLAYDVTVWDQHGCLSPQLAYVERGGAISAERFAEELGRQLAQLAVELPLRDLGFAEQAAIHRFRQEAEWRSVRGDEVTVFAASSGLCWTVVYDAMPAFVPTPLNRTVWVKPVDALAELREIVAPVRSHLEAAGVAARPARQAELATLLAHSGVHRVCALGEMQRPDLAWRPGGRPRVADWLV